MKTLCALLVICLLPFAAATGATEQEVVNQSAKIMRDFKRMPERGIPQSVLRNARGLAIITEGLLGYLPGDEVQKLWRRFATAMEAFSHGRYLADLHIGEVQTAQVRVFRVLLSAFVRGRVFLHWGSASQAEDALRAAGFTSAAMHRAATLAPEARGPGAGMAHIIEASTD